MLGLIVAPQSTPLRVLLLSAALLAFMALDVERAPTTTETLTVPA